MVQSLSSSLFRFLSVLILVLVAGCGETSTEYSFTFETMGTVASCRLVLPPGLSAQDASDMVQGTFAEVNSTLSTWLPDSEISRLNRAPADSAVAISSLMQTCLRTSQQLHEQSGGAFDPTAESLMRLWGFYRRQGCLPEQAALDSALADLGQWDFVGDFQSINKIKPGTRFDLGGIAKGLAVDLAAARLGTAGVQDGLIDLGGNLFCFGGAPDRLDWRVGIRNPKNRDELFATVVISDLAVATSGSYERFVEIEGRQFGHIMNPATGRPAEGLLSVTVVADQAILADGLSTTLFVLGPEKALPFLRRYYPDAEAVLVMPGVSGHKATVLATRGLEGNLSLRPAFADLYSLEFD
jgi:thiamine biosynthesis lipoprotein